MPTKTIDANDEEAVLAAAAKIQEERQAKAQVERTAAQAALREKMAPALAFVESAPFKDFCTAVVTVRDQMMMPETDVLYGSLKALVSLLDNIPKQIPADMREPA